jgi:transposase InsO family protein
MEAQWQADRSMLRTLLRTQPLWTQRDYAQTIGRSVDWVKKWAKRLRAAPPDDVAVLRSQSRARTHPPPRLSQTVIDRLLEIRSAPPAPINRIPGPKTIRYYLQQDPELRAHGVRLPRSTRTIWQILRQYGRIADRHHDHHPVPRPAPLTVWQLDFKDVSTVPAEPDGKRQHVVEVLDTVDSGTSILLGAQVRPDFTMETALRSVAELVQQDGLPTAITIDRDVRFVGAPRQRDFPSPFVRFWLCLGVAVTVCPPHRPDKNPFVERYHRSFEYECVRIYRPHDLETAMAVTAAYQRFYNDERPHQGLSCQNLPPRVAFPMLPTLPPVPARVDMDRWLYAYDGHSFVRKVKANGRVVVANTSYYVKAALAKQHVALRIDAELGQFVVEADGREVQRLAIKGLGVGRLPFTKFVEHLCAEARTLRSMAYARLGQQRLR